MKAYGVFNDEGMIDGPFYSIDSAQREWEAYVELDEECRVRELCAEHPEQPRDACEECNAEEE